MLFEPHTNKRLSSALTFLEQYGAERDNYLGQIDTGEKTRFAHVTPELKEWSI